MFELQMITKKVVGALPTATKLLLKPVPDTVIRYGIANVLNRAFKKSIAAGDLNFMLNNIAKISVTDTGLSFLVTFRKGFLRLEDKSQRANITISAKQLDFILLATGMADPDALFFQRRLSIRGDTDLGLTLKNFLDSQDPGSLMPSHAFKALSWLAATINPQKM